MKILLLLLGMSVSTISGYVLLQVRKGDNQSNVDALIHKVLPSGKVEARKNYDRYDSKSNDELESIVIAIDSGAPNDRTTGAFDRVVRKLSKLLQASAMKVIPKYRSKLEKLHIKPEIVHFKSGKPSVMFEINTNEVARSIQNFLSSKEMKKYAEKVASKAAVLYRTFKEEFMKDE